ncbi:DUF4406 domain-containing protein [Escherichia coli]|nr:DUF4406 domain-containing protein [Escherichia coli]EET8268972.1 DUF4406 domain-containing protein [Escherichia coli]HAM2934466.1 DUF4406 domain-containing protein [Escherichia coli]
MRVFISGPMTGYAGFNRAAFNDAERMLKSQGCTVLNPAVLPDGLTQAQYMDICLAMVRCADTVFMLSGWEASAGARTEHALAEKLGHRILYQECGYVAERVPAIRVGAGDVVTGAGQLCEVVKTDVDAGRDTVTLHFFGGGVYQCASSYPMDVVWISDAIVGGAT